MILTTFCQNFTFLTFLMIFRQNDENDKNHFVEFGQKHENFTKLHKNVINDVVIHIICTYICYYVHRTLILGTYRYRYGPKTCPKTMKNGSQPWFSWLDQFHIDLVLKLIVPVNYVTFYDYDNIKSSFDITF